MQLRRQIFHLHLLRGHLLAQIMEFRLSGLSMLDDPVLELAGLGSQGTLHKPRTIAQPENEVTNGTIPSAGRHQPMFRLNLMLDMPRDRSTQPVRDPLPQWLFRPVFGAAVLAPILEPLGHIFQLDEHLADRGTQWRWRKRVHRPFLTLVRSERQKMNRLFRQTLLFPLHTISSLPNLIGELSSIHYSFR